MTVKELRAQYSNETYQALAERDAARFRKLAKSGLQRMQMWIYEGRRWWLLDDTGAICESLAAAVDALEDSK